MNRENGVASVNVSINGRQYRMACEDGEETHLTKLATEFDERIAKLRENFGEIGDSRLIVMAALTLADELSEVKLRLARLQDDMAALQDARVSASERTRATQDAIAAAFTDAAERLESIVRKLNQPVADTRIAIG